jgi:hypothetical protein
MRDCSRACARRGCRRTERPAHTGIQRSECATLPSISWVIENIPYGEPAPSLRQVTIAPSMDERLKRLRLDGDRCFLSESDVGHSRPAARRPSAFHVRVRPKADLLLIPKRLLQRLKGKGGGAFRARPCPSSDPRSSGVVFGGDILAGVVRHECRRDQGDHGA